MVLTRALACCPQWCVASINDIEAKYYADGEDAYDMRHYLSEAQKHKNVVRDKK